MGNLAPLSQIAGNTGLIIDGDWVESKDQDPEGEIRLVQLADIGVGSFLDKSNRFMTAEKAVKLKCTYLKEGDILVARMPDPLGRACRFPGDQRMCVTVVDVCILRPDAAVADAAYVTYILNSDGVRRQLDKFIKGTTRQRISRTNLEQICIPLPPLHEQRRIAAILDQADTVRAKRREALAQLDSFAESIFIDMFGDPFINPKQWATKPLGELLESITNGANADQTDLDSGWPITRIETIWNGAIDSTRVKYVTPNEELKERYQLQDGDILFSHINSPEHIAKTAIYQGDPYVMIHGINLLRLRCSSNEVNAHWLLHLLKQPSVRTYFRTRCKKAVNQASLNQQDIKSLICIVPPLELQAIFSERVKAASAHRLLHEKFAIELDKLFQSLQQRAFRGEL